MNKNFTDFARSSKANEKVVRKVLSMNGAKLAGLEGAGEVITEVGQKFSDWWITDNKEAFDNSAGDFVSAFLGGTLMGGGIGAVSYGSQNSMNKQRRENQQNLFFTEHDNKFQEIVNIKEKTMGLKNLL